MVGKGGKEMSITSKTSTTVAACQARYSGNFSYRNDWDFSYYLRKIIRAGVAATRAREASEVGRGGFAAWFVVLFVLIITFEVKQHV